MGFFEKLKEGLKKTKDSFVSKVETLVNSFTKIDEEVIEEQLVQKPAEVTGKEWYFTAPPAEETVPADLEETEPAKEPEQGYRERVMSTPYRERQEKIRQRSS